MTKTIQIWGRLPTPTDQLMSCIRPMDHIDGVYEDAVPKGTVPSQSELSVIDGLKVSRRALLRDG